MLFVQLFPQYEEINKKKNPKILDLPMDLLLFTVNLNSQALSEILKSLLFSVLVFRGETESFHIIAVYDSIE